MWQICNLFIGAVRSKPIYHGELTCMALAMDLQAWDDDGSFPRFRVTASPSGTDAMSTGNPVMDAQGDMVITKPFPNMPIGCGPVPTCISAFPWLLLIVPARQFLGPGRRQALPRGVLRGVPGEAARELGPWRLD